MYAWETALTTRDTNRIVRPLEWGFDWLEDFSPMARRSRPPHLSDYDRMIAINADIVARADEFYGYTTPTDFRLEARHPQLFPTNVRPETLAGRRRNQTPGRDRRARRSRVPPLHLTRPHPLPRKRHRQRPLVPRPPRNAKRQAQTGHDRHAPVERRRLLPQRPLHPLQPLRHLLPPPLQALPRHPPPRRARALRLRRQRQRRPHHRSLPPGRRRHPQLPRLARISKATSSSASSAPASAAATPSSPPPSTRASRSAPSTTPPPGSATSSGPARAPATSAPPSSRPASRRIRSARSSPSSARCPTWTVSPQEPDKPRRSLVVHATYDLTFPLEYSLDVLKNFDALNSRLRLQSPPLRPLHHRRNPLQIPRRLVPRSLRLLRIQTPRPIHP